MIFSYYLIKFDDHKCVMLLNKVGIRGSTVATGEEKREKDT
jgi:hypothetical protein